MSTRSRSRNTVASNPPTGKVKITTISGTGTSYFMGLTGTTSGTSYTIGSGTFPPTSFSSKIGVDETMIDEQGTPTDYNDCTHVKRVWNFPLTFIAQEGRITGEGGYAYRNKTAQAPSSYAVSAGTPSAVVGSSSFPGNWESEGNAKARAVAKLSFGIPTSRTNLAVFLGELTDFREVFQLVMNRLQLKKIHTKSDDTMRAAASRFQKKLKNATFGDVLSWIASGDLFYQFAIKPFMADIKELQKFGYHMQCAREKIHASGEKYVTIGGVESTGTGGFFAGGPSIDHWTTQSREYSRKTTAWAQYQLETAGLPSISDHRLAAHILGLGNPAEVAWELLPFSFVVDYFVNVGECLKQFNGDVLQIPYTILKQGTSQKTTFKSFTCLQVDMGTNRVAYHNYTSGPTVYGTYEETTYRRTGEVLQLGTPVWPSLQLPNLRQVVNLAELVYLRGKRRAF